MEYLYTNSNDNFNLKYFILNYNMFKKQPTKRKGYRTFLIDKD